MESPDEKWFRERLRHFLEIRHPPRQFHHAMIERRSRLAFESYAQSVELGVPAASAVRAADKVLFRGLLFSKYDTVHLILTTDFPAIPENLYHIIMDGGLVKSIMKKVEKGLL